MTVVASEVILDLAMTTKHTCPCGEDHSTRASYRDVAALIKMKGESVVVSTSFGKYHVPRIYIAYHGLSAHEVPVLARKHGWPEAGRPAVSRRAG